MLLSSRSFLTAQHHHNTCVHWCPIRLWKRRKRGAFELENHRYLITQACPRLVTISYIRKSVGYIISWDNLGSLGSCSLVVRLRYASGCQYQLSCQLNGGKVLTMWPSFSLSFPWQYAWDHRLGVMAFITAVSGVGVSNTQVFLFDAILYEHQDRSHGARKERPPLALCLLSFHLGLCFFADRAHHGRTCWARRIPVCYELKLNKTRNLFTSPQHASTRVHCNTKLSIRDVWAFSPPVFFASCASVSQTSARGLCLSAPAALEGALLPDLAAPLVGVSPFPELWKRGATVWIPSAQLEAFPAFWFTAVFPLWRGRLPSLVQRYGTLQQ